MALFRRTILLVSAVLALSGSLVPAHAAKISAAERSRFVGIVASVSGPMSKPSKFSIQLVSGMVDVVLTPHTKLVPKSAEASVEELATGDYVVAYVRRTSRTWVVLRLDYDVQPIPPLRAVSGVVERVSANGRGFLLKLDTAGTRWISLGRQARIRVDGRLADPPPPVMAGESLQAVVLTGGLVWAALQIDLRSSF